MTRRALVAIMAGCLGAAGGLLAQQPTFRARVDHVTLDVVVTDKDEVPVTGLAAKDFEVTEHDKTQTLADFTPVTIPARPPIDPAAAPLPARDVASNAAATERSRAIVFLVAAIPPKDIVKTQRVLIKMIESLTADDQAAIVFVRSSTFSQDFTNDVGRLVAATERMRFALASGGPGGANVLHFAVDNALHALEAAKQPRKLFVWVGEIGIGGKDPTWQGAFEKLQRAGIPIYPIDPIAMQVEMPRGQKEFQEPDAFPDMAQNTGGHDYLHPGDPVATAGELMAANSTYYLLGYYPDPFARDDKFHDVHVRMPGHPDWHVRARQGYWARTDKATPDAQTALNKDLGAGLDDPGLPIQVFATPIEPAPNGGMRTLVTTTVTYPPRDAATPRLDDELRVGILALDPDAGVKAEHHRVVPLKGAASPGALTLVIDDEIDLPATAVTLRVGVESRARATAGTAHLKLDVPNTRKDDLALSGVVIGWSGNRGTLNLNPEAIAGLSPFHPTTSRTFSAGDEIRVYCRAFWKANAADAQIDTTVGVSGSTFERALPLNGTRANNLYSATLDTMVPLRGVTAGTHVLIVTVTRPKPKVTATRQVVFDVK